MAPLRFRPAVLALVAVTAAACSATPDLTFVDDAGDAGGDAASDSSLPVDSGGSVDAQGTDAGGSVDAGRDAAPGVDSSVPGKYKCGTVNVDSCDQCPTGHLLCTDQARNECLADCTTCNPNEVACVYCTAAGAFYGTCVTPGALGALQCNGGARCACTNQDPTTCPGFTGSSQTCIDLGNGVQQCRTCGEGSTMDAKCQKWPSSTGTCTQKGSQPYACK